MMSFEERLLTTRKNRGMSQEALAEKIGVSRQAVSKWETGEAQPDYAKLIALADALEVSLDYLCGREPRAENVPTAATERPKKKQRGWVVAVVWTVVVAIVAVLIVGAVGLLVENLVDHAVEEPQRKLPEEFSVKDVSFNYVEGEGLHFQFVPSVTKKGYTYHLQVSWFDGSAEYVKAAEAEYAHGVCSGVIELEPLPEGYEVYFVISNGFEGVRTENTIRINHDGSYPG